GSCVGRRTDRIAIGIDQSLIEYMISLFHPSLLGNSSIHIVKTCIDIFYPIRECLVISLSAQPKSEKCIKTNSIVFEIGSESTLYITARVSNDYLIQWIVCIGQFAIPCSKNLITRCGIYP